MKQITITLFSILSCFFNLQAQVATWNSTSGTGTTGVTAGTATLGAGLTVTSVTACGNNVFTVVDIFDTGETSPTTAAAAVNDNEYIDFPITADAGYTITITSVQFSGQKSNTGGNNTGLYNGTTDISSGGITWSGTTCGTRTIDNTDVVIPPGTTVNFRLYVWGATGTTGSWRIGSVQFLGTALPISLTEFDAKAITREITLSFSTATEHNNDHFDIERSADGRIFEKIGEVKGAGNSIVRQDYTYTDQKPLNGVNYYRLKQVDFDGAFTYSPVRSVVFGKAQSVTVFPTPANSTLTIRLDEALTENAQWQIMDMTGRVVGAGTFVAENNEYSLPVSTLTEGAYVLQIATATQVLSQQFRKQ